jgi:hypothetical protein
MKLEKTIEALKGIKKNMNISFDGDNFPLNFEDTANCIALTHAISVLECRLKHDQPCHCWKEYDNAK